MSPRHWKFRIADMIGAIEAVLEYTDGYGYGDFAEDRKTVDAVVRNFIIIGEAAVHVPEEICNAHPEIPWKDMRDMRNYMVHVYLGTSIETIWETITYDLPPLLPQLKTFLEG